MPRGRGGPLWSVEISGVSVILEWCYPSGSSAVVSSVGLSSSVVVAW